MKKIKIVLADGSNLFVDALKLILGNWNCINVGSQQWCGCTEELH